MTVRPPLETPEVPVELLGDPRPAEVLYEAESPIVFTITASTGTMLGYLAAEDTEGSWIVLAPIGPTTLQRLRTGLLAVRACLTDTWMWLALHRDGAWRQAWRVSEDMLPPGHLPRAWTPLLPEHQAILSTRVLGSRIQPGVTPASVVAFVADATRSAVKTLVEFVYDQVPSGRPKDDIRELYDLPVRQLAFNSFAIGFGAPPAQMFPAEFDEVVSLLRRGIDWVAASDDVPLVASSDRERSAILHAVRRLTPPKGSYVEVVELAGPWVGRRTVRLTTAARKRVSDEIAKLRDERVLIIEGRIGEFDDDRGTFILRDTNLPDEVKATIRPENLERVRKLYTDRVHPVWAVGVLRERQFHVSDVFDQPPLTAPDGEVDVEPDPPEL